MERSHYRSLRVADLAAELRRRSRPAEVEQRRVDPPTRPRIRVLRIVLGRRGR